MSDNFHLNNTEWDCCVIGNGVSSLWLSHWLWCSKKSVLWITSEQPYSSERAMLQHGWLWAVTQEEARFLQSHLKGFGQQDSMAPVTSLDLIYFDAKSSKRFRKFTEIKQEWAESEKNYFENLLLIPEIVDLWQWHEKLHSFHGTTEINNPTTVELFHEPRFVRMQGLPVMELQTVSEKISGVTLSFSKPDDLMFIKAHQFYLGDFDENQILSTTLKGKSYRAGFGLKFWHQNLDTKLQELAIIPLLVNPTEKNINSHVVGRFVESTTHGLQSFWIGLLTDTEVENNNEILKKMKQTKRAIDRAIPGFSSSIIREAMTFEPKMQMDLIKDRPRETLGAYLISDCFGSKVTIEMLKRIFESEGRPCNLE